MDVYTLTVVCGGKISYFQTRELFKKDHDWGAAAFIGIGETPSV